MRELLAVLAKDEVPARPGRREPRAVKGRPKPFPLLNRHRRRYKKLRTATVTGKTIPEKQGAKLTRLGGFDGAQIGG